MISKMWVKSKFVLFQRRSYNLLTQKKYKKVLVFGVLVFFLDVPLLSISRNSFQIRSLDDKSLENFTLPNSIILVEDLIK